MGNCISGSSVQDQEGECLLDDSTRVGPEFKGGRPTKEDYRVVHSSLLGIGRMASVREGVEKATGRKVAVKACSKKLLLQRPARMSRTIEIEALIRVSKPSPCPYIAQLLASFEDKQNLYLVMELLTGGDLFHYIAAKETLSEADVRMIVRQVLEAVKRCHEVGVVHRDLKPENIMMARARIEPRTPAITNEVQVKLVDFGSAAFIKPTMLAMDGGTEQDGMPQRDGTPKEDGVPNQGGAPPRQEEEDGVLHDFMGTAFYCAPEVYAHAYGGESDLWSVGAVLYVLLTGSVPSPHLTRANIHKDDTWQQLQQGHAVKLPGSVSAAARELLSGLLHPDPSRRLTAEASLKHPWFTGLESTESNMLEGSIHGIRLYASLEKLRKAVVMLLAVLLEEHQVQLLISQLRADAGSNDKGQGPYDNGDPSVVTSTTEQGDNNSDAGKAQVKVADPSRASSSFIEDVSLRGLCSMLEAQEQADVAQQLCRTGRGICKDMAAAEEVPLFTVDQLVTLLQRHVGVLNQVLEGGGKLRRNFFPVAHGAQAARKESSVYSPGGKDLRVKGHSGGGFFRGRTTTSLSSLLSPKTRASMPTETYSPGKVTPKLSQKLGASLGTNSSFRHVQSLLELSTFFPANPVENPGNLKTSRKLGGELGVTLGTEKGQSVHGEQLYKDSAFLPLGMSPR